MYVLRMLTLTDIAFIKKHIKDDAKSLMMKYHGNTDLDYKFLITQVSSRQKIQKKLPDLYNNDAIVFPQSLNLEQSSSQATAQYKNSIIKPLLTQHTSGCDLTAGFGIDVIGISPLFDTFTHIEPNEELLSLSKANYKTLKLDTVLTVHATAEEYLTSIHADSYDFLFIDPSRRAKDSGAKVIFLEDYSPNVIELHETMLNTAPIVMIKTSPVLDYNDVISKLPNVAEVHVVAVDNEVKELLYILKRVIPNERLFRAVNLQSMQHDFSVTLDEIKNAQATYSMPLHYLYEANSAIMKMLAFDAISDIYTIPKLHTNSHLFTSSELVKDFPGRSFEVESILPYKKKYLSKIGKAHIACRNFPDSPEMIRKKTKIKNGGEIYLFATTLLDDSLAILICKKII